MRLRTFAEAAAAVIPATTAAEPAAGAHALRSVVLGAFEVIQVVREGEHYILLEGGCAGIRYQVLRDRFVDGSILM